MEMGTRSIGGTELRAAGRRAIRVLVAEDSVVMRSILRSVLTGSRAFFCAGPCTVPCQGPCTVPVASRGPAGRPPCGIGGAGEGDGGSELTGIELCGMAIDGVQCLEQVAHLKPDLLLLDIEMPRMDGLGVLDKLRMMAAGMPVIMCSALTERGARATLDALAKGAVDYVTKPSAQADLNEAIANLRSQLLPRIAALIERYQGDGDQGGGERTKMGYSRFEWKGAAAQTAASNGGACNGVKEGGAAKEKDPAKRTEPATLRNGIELAGRAGNEPQPVMQAADGLRTHGIRTDGVRASGIRLASAAPRGQGSDLAGVKIVVIGVSTGGPAALEQFLPSLPADFPVPIVVVQHMPAAFTRMLAMRLKERCSLNVQEAMDGVELKAGTVWIARGDWHVEISAEREFKAALTAASGEGAAAVKRVRLKLTQDEPLQGCRPSADVLFRSAARVYGPGVLALVMTGMGCDGLEGSREVREAGGTVIAQDRESSAIWGMPRCVTQAGLASRTLPLSEMADELIRRIFHGSDQDAGTATNGESTHAESTCGNSARADSLTRGESAAQAVKTSNDKVGTANGLLYC